MQKLFYAVALALVPAILACGPLGNHTQDLRPGPDSVVGQVAPDSETVFEPVEIRADFEALYRGLRESHYDLFARVSEAAYDQQFRDVLDGLNEPLTRIEIQIRFQRFVAVGNIAHARIEFPAPAFDAYRARGGKILPIFVRVAEGEAFVSETYSDEAAIAVGDTVVAIGGEPIGAWVERLVAHISADTPYLAHALLEIWFPRLMWLELGDRQEVAVTVRKPDASTVTAVVPLTTREAMMAAAARAAPVLELDWMGRGVKVLEADVAYLRPGPFMELGREDAYDETAFRDFIDGAFAQILDAGSRALLIDLRNNPGGDNSFSDLMIAWFADRPFRFNKSFQIRISPNTTASNQLRVEKSGGDPDRASNALAALYSNQAPGSTVEFELPFATPRTERQFEGEVFVLVNRYSFSNAVNVAAIVQDYGFGTVIGEETADFATTYGAMEHFELPRTGISVGYPKALIVRPSGDLSPRGVVPDIVIPTPRIEGPQDPVLQSALHVLHRHLGGDAGP